MKTKKFWLVTSAVTLLPMLAGLLLWDKLPAELPTHFGFDGTADGWSGKGFAVFGIPLLMLFFQIVLCFATRLDKQNRGHNEKVLNLAGLIFPAMSVVFAAVIYSHALNYELSIGSLLFPLLGVLFVLMGNWLPKVRQNSTLGIKIKWTLYSEENWNKTHRFAGFVWVAGGILFCLMGFVPEKLLFWLLPAQVLLLAAVPTVYSWALAKKQQREGTYTESDVSKNLKQHPVVMAVSGILAAVILIAAGVVMFTGDIEYTCTADALVIDADYWNDSTVPYAEIDAAEFREVAPEGTREWGWGSAKLLLGAFRNDEFGLHTRYSYAGTECYILLTCGGDTLVLNAQTDEATRELWAELTGKIR